MLRIGTSGWNYPTGKGTWNGIFYPPRTRPRRPARVSTSSRFYAEHFDTVEVNSTFYGQPRPDVSRAWAERTPPASSSRSSCTRSSRTRRCTRELRSATCRTRRRRRSRTLSRVTDADVDEFRRGIDPLAHAAQARRAARAVPTQLQGRTGARATTWHGSFARFTSYPIAVELRHKTWSDAVGDTLALLNALQRGVGADRRAEVPASRSARTTCRTSRASTTCGCTAGTPRTGGTHEHAEDRYDYLYSKRRAAAVCGYGKRHGRDRPEGVSVSEQPLLGEGGRQRGGAEVAGGAAHHRRRTRRRWWSATRS